MEKIKLYLPLEADFISNDLHSELIDRYGAHGLGVYFMVLMELRNHEGYRCGLSTLKGAARRCMTDPEILQSVLCDFGLFEFAEHGNRIMISSVYIHRVMQPFDEKTASFPPTANENTVTVEPPVYGMSTVTNRIILNKIEIKIKTKTTNTKAAAAAKIVDAAVDTAVTVATVIDNVPTVNEAKPKTVRAALPNHTPAQPLTATPVPCHNEAAKPQGMPWIRRYPNSALPANSRWNHCVDSCGKAPPHLCRGAVCPAAPRGGFRRKAAGPCQPFATQPAGTPAKTLPSFGQNATGILPK